MTRSPWNTALLIVAALIGLGSGVGYMIGAQIDPPVPDQFVTIGVNGQKVRCRLIQSWKLSSGGQALQTQSIESGEMFTIVREGNGDAPSKETPVRIFRWADAKSPPPGSPFPPKVGANAAAPQTIPPPNAVKEGPNVVAPNQAPVQLPTIINGTVESPSVRIAERQPTPVKTEPTTGTTLNLRDRVLQALGKNNTSSQVNAPAELPPPSTFSTSVDPQSPWSKPGQTIVVQPGKATVDSFTAIVTPGSPTRPSVAESKIQTTASAVTNPPHPLPPSVLPSPRPTTPAIKGGSVEAAASPYSTIRIQDQTTTSPALPPTSLLPASLPAAPGGTPITHLPPQSLPVSASGTTPPGVSIQSLGTSFVMPPLPPCPPTNSSLCDGKPVRVTVKEEIIEVDCDGKPLKQDKTGHKHADSKSLLPGLFGAKQKTDKLNASECVTGPSLEPCGPSCSTGVCPPGTVPAATSQVPTCATGTCGKTTNTGCLDGTMCDEKSCSVCVDGPVPTSKVMQKQSMAARLRGFFKSSGKAKHAGTGETCGSDCYVHSNLASTPFGGERTQSSAVVQPATNANGFASPTQPILGAVDRTRTSVAVLPGYAPFIETVRQESPEPGTGSVVPVVNESNEATSGVPAQDMRIRQIPNTGIPSTPASNGASLLNNSPIMGPMNRSVTVAGLSGKTMADHPALPRVSELPFVTTSPARLAAGTPSHAAQKPRRDGKTWLFERSPRTLASSTNLAKVNHGEGMQPYNAFTPAPAQPAAPPANPMLVNAYRNANLPPQMPNAMPFAMPQMGSYAMTAPPGMWGGQPTNLMPPSETLVPVHGYDIPAQPTQLPLQPVGYQTPATPGFVQASNQAMDRPTSLVATPNSMGNARSLIQLVQTIKDSPHPSQRELAVNSLATFDWRAHPEVLGLLNQIALTDPAATVRAACVANMSRMNIPVPVIFNTLQTLRNDSDVRVRHEVENAFARFDSGRP